MQVSPCGVEVQVVPAQQSLPLGRQNCPRAWHRHVPSTQSMAPQQSSEPAQLWLAVRHTQRPPVQSCVPQHSALFWQSVWGAVVVKAPYRQQVRRVLMAVP